MIKLEQKEKNKDLLKLFTAENDVETKEYNFEELFPDLSEEVLALIENNESKKLEITKWIDAEIKGAQFNAVRLCCIPDENDNRPDRFNDDLCESYKICPLYKEGIAPVGKLCSLEKLKVTKITKELVDELQINIFNDYTDKYIIGELVTYSLIEDRATRALAASSLGMTSVTLGKNGKEYKKLKSFYLDIIKEMRSAKDGARKALLATREEKLKASKEYNVPEKEAYNEIVKIIENRNNKTNNGLLIDLDEDGENNA